jgi:hypothetical protein
MTMEKRTKVARCATGACLEAEFRPEQVVLTSTTGKGGSLVLSNDEWNTFLADARRDVNGDWDA